MASRAGTQCRLLVVGASPMRSAAFGVWREMGLDIVLVDGHSQQRYEDLVASFHGLDAHDGSTDPAAIRRLARGWDGITSLPDEAQAPGPMLPQYPGLPEPRCAVA